MGKVFLIAGVGSGCGKTTITASIVCALRERGFKVQPFKVGPDYIDPQHLSAAAGRSCRNLDVWMMGEDGVRDNFARGIVGADIAVIEGVGGIYDGLGTTELASTAHVAKILDVPVILVLDAWGISRTSAAIVDGIIRFDRLRIRGVIFNFVGSEGHYSLLKKVVEEYLPQVKVLGGVVRSKKGFIPERHLGILQAHEIEWQKRRQVLLDMAGQIDLDGLIEMAEDVHVPPSFRRGCKGKRKVVAVARDRAFSFVYTENLEALEELAHVRVFSPLEGETFSEDADALFLPGGYPELWAERLMENRRFLEDLRHFVSSGLPVYAECGGLIFLARKVVYQGRHYPMADILPVDVEFGTRPILGYAEGHPLKDHPFTRKPVRGHIFHYSRCRVLEKIPKAYRVYIPSKEMCIEDGFVKGNLLATYLHTCWLYSGRSILEGMLEV